MLRLLTLCLVVVALATPARSQTLSGIVTDANETPIPLANIVALNTPYGTASGSDGRFELSLAPGPYDIQISAVGFATQLQSVRVTDQGATLRVELADAQEALGALVVTATRDEQNLIDTPVAVTAIDGREADSAQIWGVDDLIGRVPSYLAQEAGVGFQAIQSIRGLQVFSETPAITVVVDGVPNVDILAGGFTLTDIERIEVLRGPQTTLFGRNALGGVINVITRRPTATVEGYADASVGNLGLQRYAAGMRGPVSGTLFAGASAVFETRDGYFVNDTTGTIAPRADADGATVGDETSFYGNASLRWLPSARWSVALNAKAQLDASDASGFFVGAADEQIAFDTPDVLNLPRVGSHTRDIAQGALSVTYVAPLTDVTATSTVQQIGLSFEDIASSGLFDSFADGEPGGRGVQTVLSQELRMTTAGRDLPVQATAGLYGFLQTAREPTTNLISTPSFVVADASDLYRNVADNSGFAAYGQATADLTNRLAVTLGLRYDVERREATFNGFGDAVFQDGQVSEFRPDTTVSGTYSALSPTAAVSYALTDAASGADASVYARYTRGFRAGGVNAQRLPSGLDERVTFDPEFSDNLEVGVRGQIGPRVYASLTGYSIWWDDLQFFNLVAAPFTFARENIGDARSQGIEAELSAVPVDGLRLDIALSVLDTETAVYEGFVLERLDASFEPVEIDITGQRIANAPAHTAFAAAEYRVPVAPGAAVFARGSVRSVGGYFTDVQNDLRQDAYEIVDARLGAEIGRFETALWVQNLTDARPLSFGAPDTSFNRRSVAGPPRTFGVTVRARY
ncbi:MAG: TonB-dependent receptor [Bacteroidota bacterium]